MQASAPPTVRAAAPKPVCIPVSSLLVHNCFAALSPLRDAELSSDGFCLSEPSPVDELQERYYALLASTPDYLLDMAFGPGRTTYDPFEAFSGQGTSTALNSATGAAAPAPPDRVAELNALQALIDEVKKQDSPSGAVDDGRVGPPSTGKPRKGRRRKTVASDAQLSEHPEACSVVALQLSVECFTALQKALITPCNVDACAPVGGTQALLPDFCCCEGNKSFFARQFKPGDFLWIHPPRQMQDLFLAHYRMQKARCPRLGACKVQVSLHQGHETPHAVQPQHTAVHGHSKRQNHQGKM